jgi:hypothetical protein
MIGFERSSPADPPTDNLRSCNARSKRMLCWLEGNRVQALHAVLSVVVGLLSTVFASGNAGFAAAANRGGYGAISAVRIDGNRLVEAGPQRNGVGGGDGGVVLGADGKLAVRAWAGKPTWVVNGRVPLDEWGYNFPGGSADVYEFAAEGHMAPPYRLKGAPSSVLYSFYTSLHRFHTQERVRPGTSISLAERRERGHGYRTYHYRDGSPFLVKRWSLWEITIGSSAGRVNELRVDPAIEPSL